MNEKIRYLESESTISDFIRAINDELPVLELPKEKSDIIKKHSDSDKTDYHSLQAIIDVLISVQKTGANESIIRLCNRLYI